MNKTQPPTPEQIARAEGVLGRTLDDTHMAAVEGGVAVLFSDGSTAWVADPPVFGPLPREPWSRTLDWLVPFLLIGGLILVSLGLAIAVI